MEERRRTHKGTIRTTYVCGPTAQAWSGGDTRNVLDLTSAEGCVRCARAAREKTEVGGELEGAGGVLSPAECEALDGLARRDHVLKRRLDLERS